MNKLVSIVIPLFNEETIIPTLLDRLHETALQNDAYAFEFIFVDDGSTDRTLFLLKENALATKGMRVISLSRNFGHQAAISAGLTNARGDAVIVMDGDLQDSPDVWAQLLAKFEEGFDVVYAIRTARNEGIIKRSCYFVFYRLLRAISRESIPSDAGDFALMSRRTVQAINELPERARFLRGLRAWVGFKQIGIPVARESRLSGKPKYSVIKLVRLALDGCLSFSAMPLRLSLLAGLFGIVLSASFTVYAIWIKVVYDISPSGFTAILVVLVFLSAIQLLSLGIIGEYIGRIFEEQKQRPHFIVKDEIEHVPDLEKQQ